MKAYNKRSGFTLIELMVVVVIILLIVSIMMPAFVRVLEHGRLATCANNLHAYQSDYMSYCGDHDGYFINMTKISSMSGAAQSDAEDHDIDGDGWKTWIDVLGPNGCTTKYEETNQIKFQDDYTKEYYMAPMCPEYTPEIGSSYASNRFLGRFQTGECRDSDGNYSELAHRGDVYNPYDANVLKLSQVSSTSRTPLLGDGPGSYFDGTVGYHEDIHAYTNDDNEDGTLGFNLEKFADMNDGDRPSFLSGVDNSELYKYCYPSPHVAKGSYDADIGSTGETMACWYEGAASFVSVDGSARALWWNRNDLATGDYGPGSMPTGNINCYWMNVQTHTQNFVYPIKRYAYSYVAKEWLYARWIKWFKGRDPNDPGVKKYFAPESPLGGLRDKMSTDGMNVYYRRYFGGHHESTLSDD